VAAAKGKFREYHNIGPVLVARLGDHLRDAARIFGDGRGGKVKLGQGNAEGCVHFNFAGRGAEDDMTLSSSYPEKNLKIPKTVIQCGLNRCSQPPKVIAVQTQAPLSVANYLIGKAQQEGVPMTPMKLLKLVYIAHGWCLGLYGEPLIAEQVQAWRYGPVVRSVYNDFRHYGRSPIESQKVILTERGEYVAPTVHDPDARELLDRIWDVYKVFDGLQLSDITHHPGTPWDITWAQAGAKNAQIPLNLIQEHYHKLSQRQDG